MELDARAEIGSGGRICVSLGYGEAGGRTERILSPPRDIAIV
jgi:hypothetical protein